jgi:serine/threonine-protein kinase SRPK3
MVFEILSCNLLDVIKRYNYEGLPLEMCQEISRQVLKGLDFLHRVCGVIHTDLKPENVMVCLSEEELREIVENGQLANSELFN